MNQQFRTTKLPAASEACESYLLAGPSWVVEERGAGGREESARERESDRERERENLKQLQTHSRWGTLISASAVPKPSRRSGREREERERETNLLQCVSLASVVVGSLHASADHHLVVSSCQCCCLVLPLHNLLTAVMFP